MARHCRLADEGDLASAQQFITTKVLEELVFDSKQEARPAWSARAALLPEALYTPAALLQANSAVCAVPVPHGLANK